MGTKPPHRPPDIDPGPGGVGCPGPEPVCNRSLLQLAFQCLDFGRKGVVDSYQRFNLADRVQDGCMISSAKAAPDSRARPAAPKIHAK